ncbi:hypothetical protein CROQUDRAFT_581274 [Cronartium quercuum f. sp. fusiforme G11]|uniref:Autophagy-related protein 13 n=1 Tax=Cronartium quercuum f. sp. fusiforme G11 TaxID=708437 RepID=A0A9P6NKP5_9BASI|nr:hypothetical protein CROQUDRAFT_581274 [Cronartium quercuum f. sp. fusiforme G11]
MNPSRTHSRSNSQSPSTGYPSFDLYPDHPTHSPSIQPYASAASTGIAAVGGALVGAMMRGAAAGLRSGVGAATHVTHTLAGPSRKPAPASKHPPPSTPAPDSNTSTPILPNSPSERRRWEAKVDQIIHRFYIKTAQVIVDSRLEPSPDQGQFDRVGKLSGSARSSTSIGKPTTANSSERQMKRDKWFNLELEDPDYFKDELRTWKTASSLLFNPLSTSSPSLSISQQKPNFDSIPVMIFETILDLRSLPSNSILILKDFNGQDIRLNHTSFTPGSSPNPPSNQNIVLERWTVSMASPMPVLPGPELPTVYRYCIVHFRALYSLCRTLPAWPLFKRLKKPGSREHDILKIGCRLSSASGADELERLQQGLNRMSFTDEIAIDQRLSDAEPHNHLGSFRFPTVQTPYGMLQSDPLLSPKTSNRWLLPDFRTCSQNHLMVHYLRGILSIGGPTPPRRTSWGQVEILPLVHSQLPFGLLQNHPLSHLLLLFPPLAIFPQPKFSIQMATAQP